MLIPAYRLVVTTILLVATGMLFAARGVVKADGVLRVRGADASSASITVVPSGAAAYRLPMGTQRFTLELPVDDTYLVSFDRAGCPSKQLYFDTRVPGEYHASTYSFPFQVTLEHVIAERMFEYSSPVGFIRYLQPDLDFGYETAYLVKVDSTLRERLDGMLSAGIDTRTFMQPSALLVVDRTREGYLITSKVADDGEGTVAPMVSEVPRLVHVISSPLFTKKLVILPVAGPSVEEEAVALLIVPEIPTAQSQTLLDAIVIPKIIEPLPDMMPAPPPAIVVKETRIKLPVGLPVVSAALVAVLGSALREDDTIVEERTVTRRVRITGRNGKMNEYRQVTHAYGAVFYFQNSGSITARAFEAYIALD